MEYILLCNTELEEVEPNNSSCSTAEDKKFWSYDHTLLLISAVENHFDELNHPKLKKEVWQKIASELSSQNVHYNHRSYFNAETCKKKWQNLVRSYKVCLENKNKTGRGPFRFNFFLRMSELLGKNYLDASNNLSQDISDDETTDDTNTNLPEDKNWWSYDQTILLIAAVESRFNELQHPKLKKRVWLNISNDLSSQNVDFDPAVCHKKWQNLVRSYNICRDNKPENRRGSIRFKFYDEMDEILGIKNSVENKMEHSGEHNISNAHFVEVCKIEQQEISEDETTDDTNTNLPEDRNRWSYDQTMLLISAVENHYNSMNHPKLKKHVWLNIANDLSNQNVEFDPAVCQKKWQNLVRSYNVCKENKNVRSRRFQYFDRMEQVLDCKQIIAQTAAHNKSQDMEQNTENNMSHSINNHNVEHDYSITNFVDVSNINEHDISEDETTDDISTAEDKKRWSYEPTILLIAAVARHYNELRHPIFKKHVWVNIANELRMDNTNFDAAACHKKWHHLVWNYNFCKVNKNETARKFKYFKKMDQVLGDKPNFPGTHYVDMSKMVLQNMSEDDTSDTSTTVDKHWSCEQTVLLLSAVANHYNEMHHPLLKELVWVNIANDLRSQNIKFDAAACHKEWLHLVGNYNACKDNKNEGRQEFIHFDKIDEILSKKLNFSDTHFLDMGKMDSQSMSEDEITCDAKTAECKKRWSYEQTLLLLSAVGNHYSEMHHPMLKENAWRNIANDLKSKNVDFDAEACQKKWQNLIDSYNVCKNSTRKTSRGSIILKYFEKMDEILGNKSNLYDTNIQKLDNSVPQDMSVDEMTDDTNIKEDRKRWSYLPTLLLISAVKTRYNEMLHPTLKEYVWQNIATDLRCQNVEFDAVACHKKWQNLVISYNTFKVNKNNGKNQPRCKYFEKLDEILGKKPDLAGLQLDLGNYVSQDISDSESSDDTVDDMNVIKVGASVKESEEPQSKKRKIKEESTLTEILIKRMEAEWETRRIERQKLHDAKVKLMRKRIEIEERKVKALEELVRIKSSTKTS